MREMEEHWRENKKKNLILGLFRVLDKPCFIKIMSSKPIVPNRSTLTTGMKIEELHSAQEYIHHEAIYLPNVGMS